MRKATTRIIAGALSAALVLTGVNMPNKSASAASAKLNKDRVVLYVGGNNTATIKAKNVDSVKFKSKDESVAKVNKKTGKVTAKGAGKTKVIAKTDAGKLKCTVRVYKAIKTLTTDTTEVTIAPGETQTVSVGVKPAKAQEKMWKVTTSDKTVATKAKANGKKGTFDITAVAEGTATVTVSSTDGGSAPDATIKVNVVEAAQDADEDTAGADTDGNSGETTEPQAPSEFKLLESTVLTNAAKTEAYIWYATYDADGNQVENPTLSWNITGYETSGVSGATSYVVDNNSALGCLVVHAGEENTFTEGQEITVALSSIDGTATLSDVVTVGAVRQITRVEFAGIMETAADGTITNVGNELPFGFADGTYKLAFNSFDQLGFVMLNMAGAYTHEGSSEGDYWFSDYASTEWDGVATPAQVGSDYTVLNEWIDGVYYDTVPVCSTDLTAVGGSGHFTVGYVADSYGNWGPTMGDFAYTVGTDADLVTLRLVAPEGRIHDGDGATISVTGVFADGLEVENISVDLVTSKLGADAVNSMYISAPSAETDTANCGIEKTSGSDFTITWADVIGSVGTVKYDADADGDLYFNNGSENESTYPEYGLYRASCFDGVDRVIEVGILAAPSSVTVETVTLSVCDPSRPVEFTDQADANGNYLAVQGTDMGVNYVDQFGDILPWAGTCLCNNENVPGIAAEFWIASARGFGSGTNTTYYGTRVEGASTADSSVTLSLSEIPDWTQSAESGSIRGIDYWDVTFPSMTSSEVLGNCIESGSLGIISYSGGVNGSWESGNYNGLESGVLCGSRFSVGKIGAWAQYTLSATALEVDSEPSFENIIEAGTYVTATLQMIDRAGNCISSPSPADNSFAAWAIAYAEDGSITEIGFGVLVTSDGWMDGNNNLIFAANTWVEGTCSDLNVVIK